MSFQDFLDNGRELRPYSPSNPSDKLVKQLVSNTFKLQTEVSRLKHDVDKLGTARDTVDLRSKISSANHRSNDLAKDIKDGLMELNAYTVDSRQKAKLLADFETILKDFQSTMRRAKTKEASSLPRQPEPTVDAKPTPDMVEEHALIADQQRQEFLQIDNELEYNEALIEERDQGIQDIQQQITEVNEIFQDLAVLVNDQGAMIDDIEANISHVADHTNAAAKQVVKAERYQKSGRNKRCFLMLIAGLVLAVLLIVLLS